MEQPSKFRTGLIFGIVTGIVYMLILVVRYNLFGNTPPELTMSSVIGYLLIVGLFISAARVRKKQLGGSAELKDLFGTLFVVILITELCFTVFNYIYLQYLDPGYLDRFGRSTMEWMRGTKVPEEKLQEFKKALEEQKLTSFGTLALGFARSVIVDSLIGLLIAFVLKKNKSFA